jgi:hypothetical protein
MPSITPPPVTPRVVSRNPVLCASALARLIWAGAALALLWTTVLWALA